MLRSFWSPLLRVVGPRLPASLSRACACAGAQFGGAPWRTSVGLGIFRVSASAALFSSTAGGDVSAPVPTPAAVASWSADDLGEFAETHLGLAPDDVEMVKAARLSGRALLKSDMSLLREHGFLLDPSAKLADFADLVRNGPPKAVRVALVGDSEPRPIVLDTQEDVEWLLRSQEASALEDQTGAWKLKLRELEDGASYAVVANKSRLSKNTVEMLDAESQSKKKGLEQKFLQTIAAQSTKTFGVRLFPAPEREIVLKKDGALVGDVDLLLKSQDEHTHALCKVKLRVENLGAMDSIIMHIRRTRRYYREIVCNADPSKRFLSFLCTEYVDPPSIRAALEEGISVVTGPQQELFVADDSGAQ